MRYLLLIAFLAACHPGAAQPIFRNPLNETGNYLQSYIEFAAWSWSQRTGVPVHYAGISSGQCEPGKITVRSYTHEEYAANGLNPNAASVVADCGTGRIIIINPSRIAWRSLLLHEVGHALGFWEHSSDIFDVMHAYARPTSRISTADALNVLKSPSWVPVSPPSLCHIEFDPDYTLVIPEINGRRAILGYLGTVDGYHTWAVLHSGRQPDMQGCNNATLDSNGIATLTDIRSMSRNYQSATFQFMGGISWRLTSLTP